MTTTTLKIIIKYYESWILSNSTLIKLNPVLFYKNPKQFFFFKFSNNSHLDRLFFKKYNFQFFQFFKKNLYVISFNKPFYSTLLHLYFVTAFFIKTRKNIFCLNSSFKEINANLINLNYNNTPTFSKNFFFFFFKFNFLKKPQHVKKFIYFLNTSETKLLFFFNARIPSYALAAFTNKGYLLGGLVSLKKSAILDFPFFLDATNIFNVYFFYLFFIKLSIYRNILQHHFFFKKKFIFYSFFELS